MGAIIDLISFSLMRNLGGKEKSTNMTLTLLDKSSIVPYGIMKYVLIQVESFIYLVNFVVVDIEEEVLIILGRPFSTKC